MIRRRRRRFVLLVLAVEAADCAPPETRDAPEETRPVSLLDAASAEARTLGGAVAAPDVAAEAAIEVAPPPPRLTARLAPPAEPLVADRPFLLGLRVRNDGNGEVRLRPGSADGAPAGTLRLRRGNETLGELPLSADGWATALGRGPAALAPGAEISFDLARPRAPTASGDVRLLVEYAFVDDRGAPLPLEIPPAEVRVTWTGLTVVHIGDSQVANGLTHGLARRVREAGGHYVSAGWVSSNAARWLGSDRLRDLLHDRLPEIVLVTLGTNEYAVEDLEHYLESYERLAERVGAHRRCFWIGPPALPGVDRFVEAARTRTAPCPFFDSRRIEPDSGRRRDHLSAARGEEWAEAIWAWIGTQWRP